ncbi:hypothetical protein M3Y99_00421300 [Aphelenchoides fujianensis]|nr:hypothetical protein M3Y99_00421300 [Aphelenchoides fujianensis]
MMAANAAARPKAAGVERLKRREQRLSYGPAAFNSTPTGAIQPIRLNFSPIGQPLLREDVGDAPLSPTFVAHPSASSAAFPPTSADAARVDSPPTSVFVAPKPPKRRAEVPLVPPAVDTPVAAASTPPTVVPAPAAAAAPEAKAEKRPPSIIQLDDSPAPAPAAKPADSPALPTPPPSTSNNNTPELAALATIENKVTKRRKGVRTTTNKMADVTPVSVPAVTQQLENVELNARGRPKRAAAPTNLKEPSLNKKMRRPN